MTDEEKKAIQYLKQNNIVEIQYDNYGLESIHRVGIDEKQTILNLIEKQSKEIEELKEQCKEVVCIPEGTCFMLEPKDVDKKWEDKIKAILEQYKYTEIGDSEKIIEFYKKIQSLLEKE